MDNKADNESQSQIKRLTTHNSPKLLTRQLGSVVRQKSDNQNQQITGKTSVIENGFWQGTLIYMEIGTGEEIDPNQIVDYRTDAAGEFNELFVETGELESLW